VILVTRDRLNSKDRSAQPLPLDRARKEVTTMARGGRGKTTSAKVATKASKALADGRSSARTRSVAASALAQAKGNGKGKGK
jgi:hypothetical protein